MSGKINSITFKKSLENAQKTHREPVYVKKKDDISLTIFSARHRSRISRESFQSGGMIVADKELAGLLFSRSQKSQIDF